MKKGEEDGLYTIYPETLPASALTSTIKKIRDRLKTAALGRALVGMHVLSGIP